MSDHRIVWIGNAELARLGPKHYRMNGFMRDDYVAIEGDVTLDVATDEPPTIHGLNYWLTKAYELGASEMLEFEQ